MRAWQLTAPTGPSGLSLVEQSDPVPGPQDVVIAVRAVSLQYRDLLMVRGEYSRIPAGIVPCSDAAGEVVAVGSHVRAFKPGDRVTSTFAPDWTAGTLTLRAAKSALGAGGTGVLADTLVLPEHGVMPAPAHLSHEEASTLPCAALTAWHALYEEAPITPSSTVLTIGSGGVSMFALQFARLAGARVIATTRSPGKAAALRELGASDVLDVAGRPAWGDEVRALSGGQGVDHVVEVGGQGTFDQSVRAVRLGGTISLIGTLAGRAAVNLTPVLMRNIRVQGVFVGSREMFERMNTAIAAHALRPVIDRVFGFQDAPAALEHLGSGTQVGKVVIRV